MSDIKLNSDHDLDLSGQTMYLTEDSNGESIAQRIKIALWLFKGEYFFNEDAGVPYFQSIFVKGISVDAIDNIFKSAIKAVPGVLDLLEYSSTYTNSTRAFSLTFKVRTDAGTTTLEVVV